MEFKGTFYKTKKDGDYYIYHFLNEDDAKNFKWNSREGFGTKRELDAMKKHFRSLGIKEYKN